MSRVVLSGSIVSTECTTVSQHSFQPPRYMIRTTVIFKLLFKQNHSSIDDLTLIVQFGKRFFRWFLTLPSSAVNYKSVYSSAIPYNRF
jgi:hypothetical protein